ncbi:Zinc finger BED domain-containing protein RICESLEEPER 2 [Rhizoctonia solani]|uniref:Zinc finger BED domain-containing protein RICESLEEPER 2 n=1 Tax=Rhizoctonia solani TaxID=456999 RepID=A0A0K6GCE4_9AGAM|nr:Zinc finger BED domain-containing protein RICESLEEPER 2 [Rhizoctonia solani]
MNNSSNDNLSISEHPPAKRRHTELADSDIKNLSLDSITLSTPPPPTPHPPLPIDPVYSHRYKLRGRAALNNAAETRYFSGPKHHALVFHFVDLFEPVEDQTGKLVSCVLQCGIRGRSSWKWSESGKGSTSNINNHMKSKHTEIWRLAQQLDGIEDTPEPTVLAQSKTLPFNLDEFYRKLTRWIVTGNQPFTEVENEEFQDMIVYLQPALEDHLVKANAIRSRVINHALEWQLKETLLDFVELKGAHDGQNMATSVAAVVSELGIANKVLALVSDNASNNGTLVQYLSSSLQKSAPDSCWDGTQGHVRCLAHIIHLAVMSLLCGVKAVPTSVNSRDFTHNDHSLTSDEAKLIVADDNFEASESDDKVLPDPMIDLGSGIEKIRKFSRIVRSSPQRMELFKTTAERIEEDNERNARDQNRLYTKKRVKNLILDIVTCWNSTYLMLEQSLEFSETIDALKNHPKIKIYRPYALSTSDWTAISAVCKWLKFFQRALVRISGEKYPTLSFSLHIYFVLIGYVSELENDSTVRQNLLALNGIRACKSKLHKFLDQSTKDSQYYYFAMDKFHILDPRYKDTLFKSHAPVLGTILPSNWIYDSAEAFSGAFSQFYSGKDDKSILQNLIVREGPEVDEFDRAMHDSMPQWLHQPHEPTSLTHEIKEYLSEPTTSMAPLDWWNKHELRFPRLAAMARDYLCIPGSSVAVERVLSTGRDVISLRRAALSAETIRTLTNYRSDIMLEKATHGFRKA